METLARSEPALGSEYPWHQCSVPARMGGTNRSCCSSVVGDDGRAEQGEADVGDAARCPGLDVGLVEDNLFGQGGVTATQALRVVEAQPSARGELALPGEEDLGLDVLLADAAPAPQVGELPHQVFL